MKTLLQNGVTSTLQFVYISPVTAADNWSRHDAKIGKSGHYLQVLEWYSGNIEFQCGWPRPDKERRSQHFSRHSVCVCNGPNRGRGMWLKTFTSMMQCFKKLQWVWTGPWKILMFKTDVVVLLQHTLKQLKQTVHINRLSPCMGRTQILFSAPLPRSLWIPQPKFWLRLSFSPANFWIHPLPLRILRWSRGHKSAVSCNFGAICGGIARLASPSCQTHWSSLW